MPHAFHKESGDAFSAAENIYYRSRQPFHAKEKSTGAYLRARDDAATSSRHARRICRRFRRFASLMTSIRATQGLDGGSHDGALQDITGIGMQAWRALWARLIPNGRISSTSIRR